MSLPNHRSQFSVGGSQRIPRRPQGGATKEGLPAIRGGPGSPELPTATPPVAPRPTPRASRKTSEERSRIAIGDFETGAPIGALALLIVMLGCFSTAGSPAAAPPGSITGTIRFVDAPSGPGPLAIAVYGTFPPQGPPLQSALIDDYKLPYHFRFDGLVPGTYYVGALIDVDPTDRRIVGMLNLDRDPHGYAGGGAPILLTERAGAAGADIDLEAIP